ncbi:uncharacterized protein LOC113562352 [Ooceraea biroi]|uniref:uncharacterized protein LOC113562352 n=1 Tax=Ooceraea biroi TaxID=2015173 RepID=UPI0005BA6D15|nr:uncharacterized protein LOC113562352 [Ooceraea biroi]
MTTKVDAHAMKQDSSAMNSKECSTGAKVKRKSRSRRRLNAMMSNASLHFSDTDSEGELTVITSKIDRLNSVMQAMNSQGSPLISVTVTEDDDPETRLIKNNLDYLIADGEARSHSRRSSIAEALTDVDEIYSDPEIEEKDTEINLKVADNGYQEETDLEDLEGDEDIQETIYVTPRSDILMDLYGETITTKEGDGPFSVEVRNRLSHEQISIDRGNAEDTLDMPDTDSEDMEASEDETKLDEAASLYCRMYDEIDLMVGSQIVMTNKMENTLHVPNTVEEAISDCHTDIEDVD